MTTIYALRDPRDGQVRYVGKTAGRIKDRLRGHLARARRGDRKHSSRWLRGLLLAGLVPEVGVLQYVREGGDWAAAERYWIRYYRMVGDLTNLADGGEGRVGGPITEEERARRRAAYTPEVRAVMAAKKRGVPQTSEAVAKRMSGWTPEVRERRRAAMRARWAEGRYEGRTRRRPHRSAAEALLLAALRGGPRRSSDVKAEASAAGIGSGALRAARLDLGVVYYRESRRGQSGQRGSDSYWCLRGADRVL